MAGIVDDLIPEMDEILGLRDDIGAKVKDVYILTRTWSGTETGGGTPTDVAVQILPTPHFIDHSQNVNLREGGAAKQGDFLLKHFSKESYPNEDDVDCSVADEDKTEKFYYIDGRLYNVISVVDSYVYWNVQVRRNTNQRTYLS